jgi:hypothetical protein|tara:strand:+ start:4508 stop:4954 length:447 start_codon:yes stop_codon:yes gene_type:complete
MAITFVNIWETKILDPIRTFLNDEFAGSIPVYTGDFKDMGNQSIRLNPIGSDLLRIDSVRAETREYILDVSFTFKEKVLKKDTWEHILRKLSHIEALFHDNTTGLNNTFYDGRFQSARINEKTTEEAEIEGLNVVRWEWRGTYSGNIT